MRGRWTKILSSVFIVVFMIVGMISYANAAEINVADITELKNAISSGDNVINLTADIDIGETISIPAGRNVTIKSAGKNTLKLTSTVEEMFDISAGATVTFNNIVLDGNSKGRLIDISAGNRNTTLNITDSVVKNGTTQNFDTNMVSGENKQRYQGGAIYAAHANVNLTNTEFNNNTTKNLTPAPGSASGGAIYGATSVIKINGGSFLNNHTGGGDNKNNGEGGAIKIDGGAELYINDETTTNIATTTFEGNHVDNWASDGGRQGGSIEATESKVKIYGATFKISGPFDTGGAIKLEGSPEAVIKNSRFETVGGRGVIGVAGGAITSENSKLLIESSQFKANEGSYTLESGGLIQVVGSGTFDMRNSTMEGSGTAWNSNWKYKTTKYGGAIVFYDENTVTAKIENTTIKNFTADISGAAIALSTQRGRNANTNLTLNNVTILNNATYTASNTNYGGGLFIGPGNTVVMNGGSISSSTYSATAGAIYNEGHLTLDGGANISGNKAYYMAGGILNDGYLKIDNAVITNNVKGDWSNSNQHVLNSKEMAGQNIYAIKDIIVTPNAVFDDRDVRVINGRSSVKLTGALTKKISVSISEDIKITPETSLHSIVQEDQIRHIGYVVAKGEGAYTPTEEDAKFFHYTTKNTTQPVAEYSDHTSIGKWDYILNPVDKTIVLGQRAKMVYHSNADDAKFADNSKEKTQIYEVYNSTAPWMTPSQLTQISDTPTRDGFRFFGWFTDVAKDNVKDMANVNVESANTFNFNAEKFTESTTPITTILPKNEIHTYAGWIRVFDVVHKFEKDANVPAGVELPNEIKQRVPASQIGKDNGSTVTPTDFADKTFTDNANNGVWQFKGWDTDSKVINGANVEFIGRWSFIPNKYKVTHKFVKADSVPNDIELPQTIKDRTPTDQNDKENGTVVRPTDTFDKTNVTDNVNDGVWEFDSWDADSKTINNGNVEFTGKWIFIANHYRVIHKFEKAADVAYELPKAVLDRTPEDQDYKYNGQNVSPTDTFDKTTINDTINDGVWSFVEWKAPKTATINRANVEFVGVWTFAPNTYGVTHKFKTANGVNLPLPQVIKDRTPGKQTGKVNGDTVRPTDTFDKTEVADDANDGIWRFDGWLKNSDTINKADVEFVGIWSFSAGKYSVTHEFVAADGVDLQLPQAIVDRRPPAQTDKVNGDAVTPTDFTDKSYEDNVNDGIWNFVKWRDPSAVTINKANVKFVGEWRFAPNSYNVTHSFKSSTAGKNLPVEISDRTPVNQTNKRNKDIVNPSNFDRSDFVEGDGKWVFAGWDKDEKTIDKSDVHFEGSWEYVENPKPQPVFYNVIHKFISGTAGRELPEEITRRTPIDKSIENGLTAEPSGFNREEYKVKDGAWIFTSWDKENEVVNGSDVLFTGIWIFNKKEEPVNPPIVPTKPDEPKNEEVKKDDKVLENTVTTPKTGDTSNIGLLIGVFVAAILGLVLIFVKRKRK